MGPDLHSLSICTFRCNVASVCWAPLLLAIGGGDELLVHRSSEVIECVVPLSANTIHRHETPNYCTRPTDGRLGLTRIQHFFFCFSCQERKRRYFRLIRTSTGGFLARMRLCSLRQFYWIKLMAMDELMKLLVFVFASNSLSRP